MNSRKLLGSTGNELRNIFEEICVRVKGQKSRVKGQRSGLGLGLGLGLHFLGRTGAVIAFMHPWVSVCGINLDWDTSINAV